MTKISQLEYRIRNIEYRGRKMDTTKRIQNFTDLNAWKESHALVLMVYELAKIFPREEIFGITNQIRRAAVSITSNLAEGFGRQTYKEKVQFYSISLGSLTELQNQLIISKDIKYLTVEDFIAAENQFIIAQKLICGLIKSTKSKIQ
jgi:four helix bundle protein